MSSLEVYERGLEFRTDYASHQLTVLAAALKVFALSEIILPLLAINLFKQHINAGVDNSPVLGSCP